MQPVPAGYPIAELSGPYIVAGLLNWGLFGTLSVQLYLYYLAFPNDRRSLKYLVYGIYITEVMQTMFVAHDMFAMYGYGFGDLDALIKMNFLWITVPIMSAIVQFLVSGRSSMHTESSFYQSRESSRFPLFVSLTSSVAAMITGVYAFEASTVLKLGDRKTSIAIGIWCGASALCDILIAICMTCYASSSNISLMRRNTGFHRTRVLVTKIIRLTIETGSVTAIVTLLTFILFIGFPGHTYHSAPALLVPKLYANAIYMVLNSRFQIIGGRDTYVSSNDMSITTTKRDSFPQPVKGTQPANSMQGQVSVVTIPNEVFNDTHEMNQMSDDCMILSA
ncbi:hypothetical protein EDD18DRAFT_1460743 [Armillaria luteobubalina]|uniref:DUF6534 domain-containing protein n=1 Tax=Armillaria luteobubalina TaxID=153913 RepID=A0AA39Q9B7_9AGAR|nr:hypothetical protein EDD18DRAFT_1460743 [Armillaria luteobubalina]